MTARHLDADRLAALLAGAALMTAVVVLLLGVPAPSRLDTARWEWTSGRGDRLLVLSAVLTLVLGSVSGTGLSPRHPPRATLTPRSGAAALAATWAAFIPAIWADQPLVRGGAFVVACLLPAALLHLVLALSSVDGFRGVGQRRLVTSGYLVLVALGLLHAVSNDPFMDAGCLVRCTSSPSIVAVPEVATGAGTTIRAVWVLLGIGAALAAGAVVRTSAGSARTLHAVFALCAVSEVAWAGLPGARPTLGPVASDVPYLLAVRATIYSGLGLVLATVALHSLQRRALLRRMAAELLEVAPPRSVREVVARRLHDHGAKVTFPVHDVGWVDEEGTPVVDEPQDGLESQRSMTIQRDGAPVARLQLSSSGVATRDLEDVLGPAALLSLEAGRTRAELLLRLHTLRGVRRQEVEARDNARRRAERDLHDGAQHRLLAAIFTVQEGMEFARSTGDDRRAKALESVLDDVRAAGAQFRSLAHGIYPVLLGDAGLVPALEGLALSGPAPLTVDADPLPRLDRSLELTAYRAVASAVHAAGQAPVRVEVTHDGTSLCVTVQGVSLEALPCRALADRAEALGGRMESVNGAMRLELPCG